MLVGQSKKRESNRRGDNIKVDFKMKCDRQNWLRILCCIHKNENLVLQTVLNFVKTNTTTSSYTVGCVQSVIYALN